MNICVDLVLFLVLSLFLLVLHSFLEKVKFRQESSCVSSLSISAECLLISFFSILLSKEMDIGCFLFSWSYATDIYFVLFPFF